MTLRKRSAISFSAAFCVMTAIFGVAILFVNGRRAREQSYVYCQKIVQSNIELIDTSFLQLKNVARIIATDPDIISAVNYREAHPQVDYSVELYNQRRVAAKIKQLDVLSNITGAVIVGSGGEYLYYYGGSPVRGYSFLDQPWYGDGLAQRSAAAFLNYHPADYLLAPPVASTVSLLMPVQRSSQYVLREPAYLLCDFTLDSFLSRPQSGAGTQIAIFAGMDQVYMPKSLELTSAQQGLLLENLARDQQNFMLPKGSDGTASYLVAAERSDVSGWSILGIESLAPVDEASRANTVFVLLLLVGACGVAMVVSWGISRSILVPMQKLMAKFNAIAEGEDQVQFEATGSVEVDKIAATARHMLTRTSELNAQFLADEKQLAEEQLKVLQHQINPHFLNNVLQSLKALAVCGDTAAISKITTLLGKLLTYSVYTPYEKVPLSEELDYTETYLALQNLRFSQKIASTVSCAEELRGFPVPKMIIQPLVENAIEHGMDKNQGGHVSVIADRDGDEIFIAVTNTGGVIPPERLVRLNGRLHERQVYQETASIGLLNVLARLQNCYGSGADLQIFSREGMNTSVVITIPAQKGSEPC